MQPRIPLCSWLPHEPSNMQQHTSIHVALHVALHTLFPHKHKRHSKFSRVRCSMFARKKIVRAKIHCSRVQVELKKIYFIEIIFFLHKMFARTFLRCIHAHWPHRKYSRPIVFYKKCSRELCYVKSARTNFRILSIETVRAHDPHRTCSRALSFYKIRARTLLQCVRAH